MYYNYYNRYESYTYTRVRNIGKYQVYKLELSQIDFQCLVKHAILHEYFIMT